MATNNNSIGEDTPLLNQDEDHDEDDTNAVAWYVTGGKWVQVMCVYTGRRNRTRLQTARQVQHLSKVESGYAASDVNKLFCCHGK